MLHTERDITFFLKKGRGILFELKNKIISAWLSAYPINSLFQNLKRDIHMIVNQKKIIVTRYLNQT